MHEAATEIRKKNRYYGNLKEKYVSTRKSYDSEPTGRDESGNEKRARSEENNYRAILILGKKVRIFV